MAKISTVFTMVQPIIPSDVNVAKFAIKREFIEFFWKRIDQSEWVIRVMMRSMDGRG